MRDCNYRTLTVSGGDVGGGCDDCDDVGSGGYHHLFARARVCMCMYVCVCVCVCVFVCLYLCVCVGEWLDVCM